MHAFMGGDFQIRAPIRQYQLISLSLPHLRAGCGGIDAYLGSFSIINTAQFRAMMQQIGANTVGLLFQAALKSINPLIAGTMEFLQPIIQAANAANKSSCEAAEMLVDGIRGKSNANTYQACQAIQRVLGKDEEEAKAECKANAPAVNQAAATGADPQAKKLATKTMNIVWEALGHTALSHEDKELLMNLTGTVIVYAKYDGKGRAPIWVEPSIPDIHTLLYGHRADDVIDGNVVVQKWWQCERLSPCTTPTLITDEPFATFDLTQVDKSFKPFTRRVEDLLNSLRGKLESNAAVSADEIGFVNTVSVPVYQMMRIGYQDATGSTFNTLIARYRTVIAFDYAYYFIKRNVQDTLVMIGGVAGQDAQAEQKEKELRDRIDTLLRNLDAERQTQLTHLASLQSVVGQLAEIDNAIRASMPADMKGMLDFALEMRKR
jgi:conjugative transfer pilus assembly protein TraH